MAIKKESIDLLMEAVNEHGLIETLYEIFGNNVKVKIWFSKNACEASIDELELSTRSQNALKRAGIHTIDSLIDALNENRLKGIRNLGNKSFREIQIVMLCYGYKKSSRKEKNNFLEWICEANKRNKK